MLLLRNAVVMLLLPTTESTNLSVFGIITQAGDVLELVHAHQKDGFRTLFASLLLSVDYVNVLVQHSLTFLTTQMHWLPCSTFRWRSQVDAGRDSAPV